MEEVAREIAGPDLRNAMPNSKRWSTKFSNGPPMAADGIDVLAIQRG
jgi:hypothetical protein